MNCEKFEKFGLLYLSDELSPDEKLSYISHIENCAICQNEIKQYRLLEIEMKNNYFIPSKKLDTEILSQIEYKLKPKKRIYKITLYSFMAAAMIAFFIFFTTSPSSLQNQNSQIAESNWNNSFFADSTFINNSLYDEISVLDDSMLVSFLGNDVEDIIIDTDDSNNLDEIDDMIDSLDDIDII